ncbi:MAG TPA: zf-HC2 domain-containing protein [Streptosporangiaceae bacterium]|nr:zf-HC2 domain-containing protein [Streptosporangiaceae bacterium]
MSEDAECAEIRELIPEIAAGVAAGDERARALAHLGDCHDCRHELAVTADLVDEMLTLAPAEEPPAGFESRVMARLAPEAKVRRAPGRVRALRRRPTRASTRAAAWLAATAAAAGLAAGAVWWQTAQDRELAASYRHTLDVAHGRGLSAAPLMSGLGAEQGTVFAYQGEPSWLYVTFRAAPQPGLYDACLVTKDGRRFALRPFEAGHNAYAWGSTIKVDVREIGTIEFARSGETVMSARF